MDTHFVFKTMVSALAPPESKVKIFDSMEGDPFPVWMAIIKTQNETLEKVKDIGNGIIIVEMIITTIMLCDAIFRMNDTDREKLVQWMIEYLKENE